MISLLRIDLRSSLSVEANMAGRVLALKYRQRIEAIALRYVWSFRHFSLAPQKK
jgi:hypothetical protein